jgi:hypothetical protein
MILMNKADYETGVFQTGLFEHWSGQFEKWQQRIREMQQRCFQLSADVALSEIEELSDVLHDTALHLVDAEKSLEAARTITIRQSLQGQRHKRRS